MYSATEIMSAWADAADHEWQRVVRDDDRGVPGNRATITRYFEAVGWGWHVPGGYVERPDNPWCGIGQAFCGLRLGDFIEPGVCTGVMLDPELARVVLPSTRRLAKRRWWDKARAIRPQPWIPDDGQAALAELLQMPRIATIASRDYGDDRNEFGGHVVLIADYSTGQFETIEFNGRGILGDGQWGEGVVVRRGEHARDVAELRRVYPLSADLHFDQILRDAA